MSQTAYIVGRLIDYFDRHLLLPRRAKRPVNLRILSPRQKAALGAATLVRVVTAAHRVNAVCVRALVPAAMVLL
jgi:hypothetical protein